MDQQGLIDTPPTASEPGTIRVVGRFARRSPVWCYGPKGGDLNAYPKAVEGAINWLWRQWAEHPYRGTKSTQEAHVLCENGADSDEEYCAVLARADLTTRLPIHRHWPGPLLHHTLIHGEAGVRALTLDDPRVRDAIHATDALGRTALEMVVANEHFDLDVINTLLSIGASPTGSCWGSPHGYPDTYTYHALLVHAARKGRWDIGRLLVDAGTMCDEQAPQERAWTWGLLTGYMPWLEQGLRDGNDPNAAIVPFRHDPYPSHDHQSSYVPLAIAANTGRPDTVRFLLAHGARCADLDLIPLVLDTTKDITESPANVDSDEWSVARLSLQQKSQRLECLRLLVDGGASAARVDQDTGRNAFHCAVSWSWTGEQAHDLFRLLRHAGADVNASTNVTGDTALHRVVQFTHRREGNLPALLAVGADPERPNKAGKTPMDILRDDLEQPSVHPDVRASWESALQLMAEAVRTKISDGLHGGALDRPARPRTTKSGGRM